MNVYHTSLQASICKYQLYEITEIFISLIQCKKLYLATMISVGEMKMYNFLP